MSGNMQLTPASANDPRRDVPTHDTTVRNIISAPLEEQLVPQFLNNINAYLDDNLLLSVKHIQILLYLSLHPKQWTTKDQSTPLGLLTRLILIHPPEALRKSLPSPFDTRTSWLTENELERKTVARMKACNQDGLFDLLWIPHSTANDSNRKRRRGEDDEAAEEEARKKRKREVAPDAWGLLEWMVNLWSSDQERAQSVERQSSKDCASPLLIAQLQPNPSLKVDSLSNIWAIIDSIYQSNLSSPAAFVSRQPLVEKILSLIIPLIEGPHFDTSAFTRSFVPLLRLLPSNLEAFLDEFKGVSTAYTFAHLLTVLLEILGGTRDERQRKRRKRGITPPAARQADLMEGDVYGTFAPPSVPYLLNDLLPLAPSASSSSSSAQDGQTTSRLLKRDKKIMGVIKISLLTVMMVDVAPITGDSWGDAQNKDEEWMREVKVSMDKDNGSMLGWTIEALKAELAKEGEEVKE